MKDKKISYEDFIDELNNNHNLKRISFSIEGYGHYRHCSVVRYYEKYNIDNSTRFLNEKITFFLTKDQYEMATFYGKYNESYKMFNIKGKGKFTLKEIWNSVVITDVEYFDEELLQE